MLDPATFGEALAEAAAGAGVEGEVGGVARIGVILRPPAGDAGEGGHCLRGGDDELDGVADGEGVRVGADDFGGRGSGGEKGERGDQDAHDGLPLRARGNCFR